MDIQAVNTYVLFKNPVGVIFGRFLKSIELPPSVMVKFGKLIKALHVQCYVHGYHLAVVKLVYNKDEEEIEYEEEETDEDDGAHVDEDEDWDENDDDDDNNDDSEDYENFKDVLIKVRTAVKFFRKSPTKTEKFLQKLVENQEKGKMLNLILDVKTR